MLINITKKLIIVFIIGILVGAIITTAGFLIFAKVSGHNNAGMTPPSFSQSNNSKLPGISDGNNDGKFNDNGQPPQMPNGNNSGSQDSNNQIQLPEAPGGGNQAQSPEAPSSNNSNSQS